MYMRYAFNDDKVQGVYSKLTDSRTCFVSYMG